MGCDIHTAVEVYHPEYNGVSTSWINGVKSETPYNIPSYWSRVKAPMWDNPYFQEDKPIDTWNTPLTTEPYRGRNYFLFAWLADVRNGSSTVTPLDEPRGVPEDASKGWKKYVKRWGADLHSMSYFTLQELLDAKEAAYAQTFQESGVLSLPAYLKLKDEGIRPDAWCGWTSAPTMTAEQFEALSDTQKLDLPRGDWDGQRISTSWEMPLKSSVEWFYEHTVERMKNLTSDRTPASHVRLVFGFDN